MKKIFAILLVMAFILGSVTSCKKNNAPQYTTVTDRDGNIYKVFKIGNQYWMDANLRTKHYADGTLLTNLYKTTPAPGHITVSDTATAYTEWQGQDTSYIYDLGLYYNWAAVMRGSASSNASPSGVQGPCPNGFHVPSDAEWQTLISYLGGGATAGGPLKGGAYWEGGNAGYSYQNASGFNALPAGYLASTGLFAWRDFNGYFWTTTAHDSANANVIILTSSSTGVVDTFYNIGSAVSCRCLQN
jgi:uncharacterized protein (TIGR02145 family)